MSCRGKSPSHTVQGETRVRGHGWTRSILQTLGMGEAGSLCPVSAAGRLSLHLQVCNNPTNVWDTGKEEASWYSLMCLLKTWMMGWMAVLESWQQYQTGGSNQCATRQDYCTEGPGQVQRRVPVVVRVGAQDIQREVGDPGLVQPGEEEGKERPLCCLQLAGGREQRKWSQTLTSGEQQQDEVQRTRPGT